jgi:O-antigen ligase
MFSMARAGMVTMVVVTLVFCLCLHQYRLLIKVTGLVLCVVAVTGMLDSSALNSSLLNLKDAVLYKGHKEEGVLGSRKTPWQNTIATIKAHPLFGSGYGTSPSGEDPGLHFGTFASSVETEREHGSSYMTIVEWVGLLGVAPFLALLMTTIFNVYRVCSWMNRTSDPRHCAIPLAMVVLAGLVHANFEDWLFAVGAYPCVYFWVFAFVLADLVPARAPAHVTPAFRRTPEPLATFGEVVSSNR